MTLGESEVPEETAAPAVGSLGLTPIPVTRTDVVLRPDCRRVIVRPFLPDEQVFPDGGLLDRILRLPEDEVVSTLAIAYAKFGDRHLDLEAVLESHFQFVARETDELPKLSRDRRLLIGAYYTGEFSIEAAALTNPSIVAAPDQSGLDPGAQRFIMSLRAIGEGQTSSIEFRSGVIDAGGGIVIEEPSRYVLTGAHSPRVFDKAAFCGMLVEMRAFNEMAGLVIDALPDRFELHQLESAIAAVEGKRAPRLLSDPTTRAMHWLATSNYQVTFPPESKLSERAIFSGSAIESHGLEDARFVRFTGDDGSVIHYATYTAYDGIRVLPQLIETVDFVSFRIETLSGACAQNKGAALFPRKIDGRYAALSRYDAENNYVMLSDSLRIWETAERIESPEAPWELARIGNCGSPLETEAGWLVITHGVGPCRTYSLGAILLDIDNPCRVIGRLDRPLLVPTEAEREGYVPNVVYSCGSMIHGDELILPYGFSDVGTRVARVPLGPLLAKLVG
jgi:predicted GH43/DUF377 family glycosyl hydrolase